MKRGTPKADTVPTLSPPIYGEHPARRHLVERTRVDRHWLDGLSLQPRYRLAAGWGAEVVRQNQDEFMQAAWEQVGEILAAERAFSLARLSRDVLKRIATRHLDKLPQARLLALLAPARARIRLGPEQTLYGRIGAATLPDELVRRRHAQADERAPADVQDGAVAGTQSRPGPYPATDGRRSSTTSRTFRLTSMPSIPIASCPMASWAAPRSIKSRCRGP